LYDVLLLLLVGSPTLSSFLIRHPKLGAASSHVDGRFLSELLLLNDEYPITKELPFKGRIKGHEQVAERQDESAEEETIPTSISPMKTEGEVMRLE
jgi:hypothetical protein